MPRGIVWDELPRPYPHPANHSSKENVEKQQTKKEIETIEVKERNYARDFDQIGRRVLFGIVCGSLTGATFGTVEVLRDVKSISSKKSVATAKILRFTGYFAGFFGTYHGMRKVLKLYVPQEPEENILTAAALSIIPLIAMPKLRPWIPYSIMLVALDALNGMNDI